MGPPQPTGECDENGQQLVAYTYDAENFRVQRTGTDGTTLYAYDRNAALTYQ